jgi:hypothetical protein
MIRWRVVSLIGAAAHLNLDRCLPDRRTVGELD